MQYSCFFWKIPTVGALDALVKVQRTKTAARVYRGPSSLKVSKFVSPDGIKISTNFTSYGKRNLVYIPIFGVTVCFLRLDLVLIIRASHPYVLQLFGVSNSVQHPALFFHEGNVGHSRRLHPFLIGSAKKSFTTCWILRRNACALHLRACFLTIRW